MLKIGKNSKENNKYMFFDCDNDFYEFSINPNPIFNTKDYEEGLSKYLTFTYDFSEAYYDAINNGITFVIKDPNSAITKHNCISHRTITKPVQNLEPYMGSEFYADLED